LPLVVGSSYPAVNSKELIDVLIPLPPLPEQQRIAEILSQIDQTIEKEQQYKEKLKRIKQGLMQDLLTGKVRVNHLVEEKENEQRYTSNFTRT
jgi:type I restriction enzyme S subunit